VSDPDDGVYRIPAFPVSSSNIHAIGFDDEKKILAVEFKSGGIYHYAGVEPDLALDLVNAESVGRFYSQNIKGKFQGQKMTGPCENCGVNGRIGETCLDCGTAKHVDANPERNSSDDRPTENAAG